MRKNDVVSQRYFELSREVKNSIERLYNLTAAWRFRFACSLLSHIRVQVL
jgi:hypothetical protein